ncbi:TetR/AcrR family transcriptional regulator [Streptomyces abyssalis]|nr:helix-turn-helix domain-containing protein [Streptomyces abyssalis]
MPREVRERQMLDAAVAGFARHGYQAASMDDIAEEAGVSKPLVYLYLKSKEDLFTACIRRERAALVEAVRGGTGRGARGAESPGTPRDRPEDPDHSGRSERTARAPRPERPGGPREAARPEAPGAGAEQQLWKGLCAFFAHTAARPDGWSVLHRADTQGEPFAREVAAMRAEITELVTLLLSRAAVDAGCDLKFAEREVSGLAHAMVGAAESLACWANARTDAVPSAKETAATLMNFCWTGLEQMIRGARWSPHH